MRKSSFVGVVGLCFAGAVAFATSSACSGSSPGANAKDGGGDSVAVDPGLDAYVADLADKCTQSLLTTNNVDPLTTDSLAAARTAFANGESDIPLSPSGCTRLLVQRSGSEITSETIIGAPLVMDRSTFKWRMGISKWTYANGSQTELYDRDADGFFEHRIATTYETSSVQETYGPGNVLVARTTATVVSGGKRMDVKTEVLRDGSLVTIDASNVSVIQPLCYPPQNRPSEVTEAGPDDSTQTRPCTPAESKQFNDAVGQAVVKETGCLHAAGHTEIADVVLKHVVHDEIKLECSDDYSEGQWAAANDRGYRDMFPGKSRILVSGKGFTPDLVSTLGHEFSHFGMSHFQELEAAGTVNGFVQKELSLSDPVYACEAACFSPTATLCNLAACMGKTMSSVKGNCKGTLTTDDIQRFQQARGSSLGACTTGHQVGALCQNVGGGPQVMLCTTQAECNVACGLPCKSYSLSCDPACR